MHMIDRTRAVLVLAFCVTLFGVLVQFPITVSSHMSEEGSSFLGAVIHYFSYLTTLSNWLLVLVLAAHLKPSVSILEPFRKPWVKAMALTTIVIVMLVYDYMLATDHDPEGLRSLTNLARHYVAPCLYLCWWIMSGSDQKLQWKNLPKYLVFPLAYLLYTYVRSQITGVYPYGFLDITENGIGNVAIAVLAISAVFLFVGSLTIIFDRKLG